MSLCCRGFLAREDLEGHVPAIRFQPVVQFLHALCLKPAELAGRNQDRAFDVSSTLLNTGLERAFASDGATRSLRNARSFKSQIPPSQTAAAKRSSNAIPRATKEELHPSIREDCNSMLVDIVSFDEIIHDLSDCRF